MCFDRHRAFAFSTSSSEIQLKLTKVGSFVRVLLGLTSLSFLGFSSLCNGQEPSIEDLFRLGAQEMQQGHYVEAEKHFRQATEISPQLAEAHLDLGLAMIREGKVEDAAKEIEIAARLNPQAKGVHMFLGISYYQMHRLNEAIAALQQEIDLDPNNPEALMWLGVVELAAGKPARAVVPLDRAAALSPKDLNVLDYRGQAHSEVAKESFAAMYKLDPTSWHVHRLQGELYSAQDRHQDAIGEYLQAIDAQPGNADLYESLGEEYRKTGQLDLAQNAYRKELQISPRNGVAMYNLGSIEIERDDAKDGVPLLEDVVKFYADAPVAKYYLGRGLAALDRNDEAIRYLKETVSEDPSSEIAKRSYYELSRIYRKQKKAAEAQSALTEYVRLKDQLDRQSAAQVEDWKKLTTAGQSATKSSTESSEP